MVFGQWTLMLSQSTDCLGVLAIFFLYQGITVKCALLVVHSSPQKKMVHIETGQKLHQNITVTSRLCTIPNHTVERQPVTATSCQLQKKKFLLKPPSTCGIHIQCATSVALSNKLNFSAAKKLPQTGDSPVVVGSPLFGASLSLAGCRLT